MKRKLFYCKVTAVGVALATLCNMTTTSAGEGQQIAYSSAQFNDPLLGNSDETNKPQQVVQGICIVGAAGIIGYAIWRCIEASGINANPPPAPPPPPPPPPPPAPPPPPPPSPVPPPLPPPPNQNKPNSAAKANLANATVFFGPLVVTTNANGELVGTALFPATGLNALYSYPGYAAETRFSDPDGLDYKLCETYILQSAQAVKGPWTNQLQTLIWQNAKWVNGATYSPQGELVESVLLQITNGMDRTIKLQSLINALTVSRSEVGSKCFRLMEGVPSWHAAPSSRSSVLDTQ